MKYERLNQPATAARQLRFAAKSGETGGWPLPRVDLLRWGRQEDDREWNLRLADAGELSDGAATMVISTAFIIFSNSLPDGLLNILSAKIFYIFLRINIWICTSYKLMQF